MKQLFQDDPQLAALIENEERRMEETINLIAAENHAPQSIMEVMGSILNTKTIEGYPGRRFHAGCTYVDDIEDLAVQRAKELFGAEFANVQPHSGTSANLAVYFSVLSPGDRVLAMSLPHGGHLSHGHKASMTSRCFTFQHYALDPETERLNYDQIEQMTAEFKPKMIVAGASSYPRLIDYERISAIAARHDALFMADIAHLAGLVAAGVIPSPVPHCDFVTFTSYKTMMGGRGGIILARERFGTRVTQAVFPGCQGTSGVNLIAAKALIFKLALEPDFIDVQHKTVRYASLLADTLRQKGYRLVTGGTDNHQVLLDLSRTGTTGSKAEKALERCNLVLNRNVVPDDAGHPGQVSGLRIGTSAVAARGMGEKQILQIADLLDRVIRQPEDEEVHADVRWQVLALCRSYPVYR